MPRGETNDIIQYLIPELRRLEIPKANCKVDVATERSGRKRGDIWISLKKQLNKNFERNIVALIEAKHKNSIIGDIDWRNAMSQGKQKAQEQELNYYIVTNCKSYFRFYNTYTEEEIKLDGTFLTKMVSLEVLQKIQSQVSSDNSNVVHRVREIIHPISESKLRKTLKKLADTYRSTGLKKGDQRIDPTVSFVVLKYISESETKNRTLAGAIKLWDELQDVVNDKDGDVRSEFKTMVEQIWGDDSEYADNNYKDFKNLISFPIKLKNEHYKKIYGELNEYNFHGASFDLFGAIYEEFASQTKKKEFGEFYTRRHITGMVARFLLRNEIIPRDLKICDPACGTGGFLTEAYQVLEAQYSSSGRLSSSIIGKLKKDVFWGYDNDEKSVARTKLNMFLVGDGHIHIYENDSLIGWNDSIEYCENEFDYIMTNPPMGPYDGSANIDNFDFTNERRYELLFIEQIIKAIHEGGEIAIVINDGALEAPTRERFRKKLLENCDIHAILSLTKFAFAPYTKEKTYILFMQKKQEEDVGEIQKFPIWHYILDYDGFANSDKRYRTKYHDDIPELEDKFSDAIRIAKEYLTDREGFKIKKKEFERKVNTREKEEGLWGMKYGYVTMTEVNKGNFYNLISEFHLRPIKIKRITREKYTTNLQSLKDSFIDLIGELKV